MNIGVTFVMAQIKNLPMADYNASRIQLLLEYYTDVELVNNRGLRAIHRSVRNLNTPAFEILVKYGVRLDTNTGKGRTILHLVVLHAVYTKLI